MTEPQVPRGGVPIDVDELFAAIGELYFQVRTLRKVIQAQQAATMPKDGIPKDALRLEQ